MTKKSKAEPQATKSPSRPKPWADHRPYRSDVPSLGVRPQNGFSKSREAQILQTPKYFPSMTFQRLERSKPLCYHE